MNTDQILDFENARDDNRPKIELLSPAKFIFLYLMTFNLYSLWWMYKSWKFFKEKDQLDISPTARAIFAIFFTYDLFDRILEYAKSKGYSGNYSSGLLFVLFLGANLTARLPDPYWLMSFLAFLFLMMPFNAFNYAVKNSDDYHVKERRGFNGRQVILIVLGMIFWSLVLIGMFFTE